MPASGLAASTGAMSSPAQRVGNVNLVELIQQAQMAVRQRTAANLTNAMSAFGDPRKTAALREIYLDLRALDGNIDELFAASRRLASAGVAVRAPAHPQLASDEYGHRLDSLRDDLR